MIIVYFKELNKLYQNKYIIDFKVYSFMNVNKYIAIKL